MRFKQQQSVEESEDSVLVDFKNGIALLKIYFVKTSRSSHTINAIPTRNHKKSTQKYRNSIRERAHDSTQQDSAATYAAACAVPSPAACSMGAQQQEGRGRQ